MKKGKKPVIAHEVRITATLTVYVEGAKDQGEAQDWAKDLVQPSWNTQQIDVEEIRGEIEADRSKRHADEKILK